MTQEGLFKIPVMRHDLNEEIPLRQFFQELFTTLWLEGASFNAKRPWGNSGWDYDVYAALIKHGVIPGKLDEDGYIDEVNEREARQFVIKNIITPLFADSI